LSKNAKNARNLERARQYSKLRQAGNKGAAKTTPQHHKRWGYRTNPEVQKRLAEQLKTTSTSTRVKTSGKKILEGAGGASQD
jgi:hypothetical protein